MDIYKYSTLRKKSNDELNEIPFDFKCSKCKETIVSSEKGCFLRENNGEWSLWARAVRVKAVTEEEYFVLPWKGVVQQLYHDCRDGKIQCGEKQLVSNFKEDGLDYKINLINLTGPHELKIRPIDNDEQEFDAWVEENKFELTGDDVEFKAAPNTQKGRCERKVSGYEALHWTDVHVGIETYFHRKQWQKTIERKKQGAQYNITEKADDTIEWGKELLTFSFGEEDSAIKKDIIETWLQELSTFKKETRVDKMERVIGILVPSQNENLNIHSVKHLLNFCYDLKKKAKDNSQVGREKKWEVLENKLETGFKPRPNSDDALLMLELEARYCKQENLGNLRDRFDTITKGHMAGLTDKLVAKCLVRILNKFRKMSSEDEKKEVCEWILDRLKDAPKIKSIFVAELFWKGEWKPKQFLTDSLFTNQNTVFDWINGSDDHKHHGLAGVGLFHYKPEIRQQACQKLLELCRKVPPPTVRIFADVIMCLFLQKKGLDKCIELIEHWFGTPLLNGRFPDARDFWHPIATGKDELTIDYHLGVAWTEEFHYISLYLILKRLLARKLRMKGDHVKLRLIVGAGNHSKNGSSYKKIINEVCALFSKNIMHRWVRGGTICYISIKENGFTAKQPQRTDLKRLLTKKKGDSYAKNNNTSNAAAAATNPSGRTQKRGKEKQKNVKQNNQRSSSKSGSDSLNW